MAPVRFLVAGLGSWGPRWCKLVVEEEGVELAAAVDPTVERREAIGSQLSLNRSQLHPDVETALREVDVDAVIIVTPPQTHLQLARQAFGAGKPVLMEKPLAASLEDAQAIVAEAKAAGQLLVVSQNYRYRPPMVTLKAALDRVVIGSMMSVAANCQEDMRLFYEPANFRYLMKHPYIIDMTIHHWDLLRYLTGKDVARVFARSWRVPDSPYQHDPACAILLDLEDGTPVIYQGSGATHRPRTSWSAWWEFTGETGRVWSDGGVDNPHHDRVHLQAFGEIAETLPYEPAASRDIAGSLRAFVSALSGGPVPAHTGADNLKSLAVVMACVESIERSAPVNVEEFLTVS
ncbi:Gfo/Idh/MocA family oxidoreductase [soil metagenome]